MHSRNLSRTRWALAAVGTALALGAGVVTPASAASATSSPAAEAPAAPAADGHYVALGDSFTSGPRIPTVVNVKCQRSDVNYPSLTHKALSAVDFTDVSCGAAKTDDMWEPQPGTDNPAQLTAVTPDTTLVTLGIGGNDIGFGGIIARCTYAWPRPIPTDNPCQRYFEQSGSDELQRRIDATAPKVADVLRAVHKRAAPGARVVLVGYPSIIGPDVEGCRQSLRIANGDQPYLRDTLHSLNAMLHREAEMNNALYVDTTAVTTGHDACQPFENRYVEGLYTRPERPALFVHPNAAGERAMADAVLGAVQSGARPRH
ncbi:SGNH/GDSL hydrolase family protein [Streptomyces sp. UNOC14_S4]|uniref:SGNH/GDSL hydrolase family protein n=1 Tax=Streptomyces sp. UNOC14_S4 TaxID=2872340 RepID=UPI001E4CA5D0|nr:SGNH/GDSL hydrolase family protein [Streptomyces sp. UNOC14_S4]MCC3770510.1 SGNH/GDSL hydrolase family protein [Streptomyces sp. UNOC14_S4]